MMPRESIYDEFLYQFCAALVTAFTWAFLELTRWMRKHTPMSAKLHDAGVRGERINVLLAEMGTKLHADIAFLSQFHNGDHYVSGSELLRKSRTHEWTAATVRGHTVEYQNVLVSLVHDECELVEEPGPSFRRTEQLQPGPFRRSLEADGVRAIARHAVRRKGDVVGFVGVDFIHEMTDQPPRIGELAIYAARIEQAIAAK